MNAETLYPARIAVKVFIDHHVQLKNEIIAMVKNVFPNIKNKDIACTESSHQKYLAITFLINVEHQEDIEQLYQTLSSHPRVKMVL